LKPIPTTDDLGYLANIAFHSGETSFSLEPRGDKRLVPDALQLLRNYKIDGTIIARPLATIPRGDGGDGKPLGVVIICADGCLHANPTTEVE
jgi:hypothetical protein